jgi:membrane protease YdiL (CAAX protease family)
MARRLAPRAVALRWPGSVRAWLVAIAAALAIQGLVSPLAGTAACAALVLLLLGSDAIASPRSEHARARALVALALVPLAGILAIALPVDSVEPTLWPMIAMVPLLIGVQRTAERLGLRRRDLGLVAGDRRAQILVASTGVPLGLAAAVVLEPLPAPDGWAALVGAAIVVGVFAGAAEELVLRGLVQPLLVRAIGPRGVAWTAALSASLYAGSRSPAIVAAAGGLALGFGVLRQRTSSIAGVAVAHGLLVAGALVIWPQVLS